VSCGQVIGPEEVYFSIGFLASSETADEITSAVPGNAVAGMRREA